MYKDLGTVLRAYRTHYVGKGNLETTGDQIIETLDLIFRQMKHVADVEFANGRFVELDSAALMKWQDWMVENGKAVATRNLYTLHINGFLRWAAMMKLVGNDPSMPIYDVLHLARKPKENMERPGIEREKTAFDEMDIANIVKLRFRNKKNTKRDQAMIMLLSCSGVRASALCNLNIGDFVTQPHGWMFIKNKGGAWERVAVSENVYAFVNAYLEERPDRNDMSAPLFLTQQNTRFNRTTLYRLLQRREKALNLPTGVHILRHSFASAIEKGDGAGVARDVLLHKNITTTNIYVHTSDDDKLAAVNRTPMAGFTPGNI